MDRLPSPKTSGFVVATEIGVFLRIRVAALFADGVSAEIGGFASPIKQACCRVNQTARVAAI